MLTPERIKDLENAAKDVHFSDSEVLDLVTDVLQEKLNEYNRVEDSDSYYSLNSQDLSDHFAGKAVALEILNLIKLNRTKPYVNHSDLQ